MTTKTITRPSINQRLKLELTVMTKRPGEIAHKRGKSGVQAGETTIYSLADRNGQKYKWEASEGSIKLIPGDRVNLAGTVKSFEPDGRIVLTRCRKN